MPFPAAFESLLLIGFVATGAAAWRGHTQRRRLAQRLRALSDGYEKSQEAYRQWFEENASIMLLLDPRSGRILEVNQSALQFYGYAREQLLGENLSILNHLPEQELLKVLNAVTMGSLRHIELKHFLSDGSPREVEVSSTPITYRGELALQATIHDDTARRQAEREVARHALLLDTILDSTPDVVFSKDIEGRYQVCNPTLERLLNRKRGDIIGHTDLELFPENQARIFQEEDRRTLETQTCLHKEEWITASDGSKVLLDALKACLRAKTGETIGILGVARDITQQREFEERLRLSEARHRLFFEKSPDAYLILNGPTFVECNEKALILLGASRKEVIGASPEDFSPEFQPDGSRSSDLAIQRIQTALTDGTQQFEWMHQRKDGNTFWVEVALARLSPDSETILVAWRDITQRKEAEQALQQSQERLQNILEATHAGTWEWDLPTGRTTFNDRWAEIIGYSLAELQPTSIDTWIRLAHPADLQESNRILQKHFAGEVPYYDLECRMRHKNGGWIWVHDRGKVVEWSMEGSPLRMSGTHTEITERKAIQAQITRERDLFVCGPVMVLIWGAEAGWPIRYVSQNVTEVLGYTSNEFLEIPNHTSMIHPEDLGRVRSEVAQALDSRSPRYEQIYRLRKRDGSYLWFHDYTVPRWDEDGTLVELLGYGLDITNQKQAEERLAKSEQRFRGLFDLSPEAISLTRMSDGRLAEVNEAWTHLFGFSHSESVGRSTHELELYVDLSNREVLFQELESRGTLSQTLLKMKRKDGEVFDAHLTARILDIAGEEFLVVVLRNISDLIGVQEALAHSERRFRSLFQMLPTGITITDPTGHIIDSNPASERLLGIPSDEFLRREFRGPYWEIVRPDGSPMPSEEYPSVRAFKEGRQIDGVEMGVRRPDESLSWITVSAAPVDIPGIGVLITYSDVSARKRAEDELRTSNLILQEAIQRAEAANVAKSQFLANMSHEIRTPLNGVLGMTELLASTSLSSEQKDYLSAISRSGTGLLALLNDILDFSKIEAGQLRIESVPFDLEQLVFDVVELFRGKVGKRAVELLINVEPETPSSVIGDPDRLRQVLSNLMSNAVKFTDSGFIFIEVQSQATSHGVHCFTIRVKDTGIGISPSEQAKLFRPFVQADASTARRYGGTGLGLALARRLMEAMKGNISLESKVGEGSCFTLTLPLSLDSQAKPIHSQLLSGKRILVLDDLPINQSLLKRQLESQGALAFSTTRGTEALARLEEAHRQNEPMDAVIVDLNLAQDMNGEAFGQRVLQDARWTDVTLVVLTATAVPGDAARLSEIGFDGYLVKPISAHLLALALQQAMIRHRDRSNRAMVTRHSVPQELTHLQETKTFSLQGRVLLVEDQEVNQIIAQKFLEDAGLMVELASNGKEALMKLSASPFDLVLMDCQMPEMDGFEATRQFRAREGSPARRLPILAMTAHAMAGDRDRCLTCGMDDYLTKPISKETLLRHVATWLNGSNADAGDSPTEAPPATVSLEEELDLDSQQFGQIESLFRKTGKDLSIVFKPFMSQGATLLKTLREHLEQNNREGIRFSAHTLKGSSLNLGLRALGRVALKLERESAEVPRETLEAWLQEAEHLFEAACEFLKGTMR